MKYIKLFGNHSGYTEYVNGEVTRPNVSHCIQENEVHYDNVLVLPGNEETWELYSSLVCDSARLDEDLRNIFSKYEVTSTRQSVSKYDDPLESDLVYTDNGTRFSYSDGMLLKHTCDIFTSRTAINSSYALAPVTNDCGQNVLPGGVGQWEMISLDPTVPFT